MIIIFLWSIVGLINLFNENVPMSIRLVLLCACIVIIIQQLDLMGVFK